MKNQNGEAFTFVMAVMMVGMLLLGGMALMHRDPSRSTKEQEQEYPEKTQHMHSSDRENASTPVEDESKF